MDQPTNVLVQAIDHSRERRYALRLPVLLLSIQRIPCLDIRGARRQGNIRRQNAKLLLFLIALLANLIPPRVIASFVLAKVRLFHVQWVMWRVVCQVQKEW